MPFVCLLLYSIIFCELPDNELLSNIIFEISKKLSEKFGKVLQVKLIGIRYPSFDLRNVLVFEKVLLLKNASQK